MKRRTNYWGVQSRKTRSSDSSQTKMSENSSCLICHEKISPEEVDDAAVDELLNQIASILEVPSSVYDDIDVNEVPGPLLCASCEDMVIDAVKFQRGMKVLQNQLMRLVHIIKKDLNQSFRLDCQVQSYASERDCSQITLMRRNYAQYWNAGGVSSSADEIPHEVKYSPPYIQENYVSPSSVISNEAVDKTAGSENENSDDLVDPSFPPDFSGTNDTADFDEFPDCGENESNEELVNFNHSGKNESVLSLESDPLKLTNSSGCTREKENNTSSRVHLKQPERTTRVLNPRVKGQCSRCGKIFSKAVNLRLHLKRKYPCANLKVIPASDSSVVAKNNDITVSQSSRLPVKEHQPRKSTSQYQTSIPRKINSTGSLQASSSTTAPVVASDPVKSSVHNYSMRFRRSTAGMGKRIYYEIGDNDSDQDSYCSPDSSSDSEFEERDPKRKRVGSSRSDGKISSSASQNKLIAKAPVVETSTPYEHVCPQCHLKFTDVLSWRTHRMEAHGYLPKTARMKEPKFQCGQCDKRYTKRQVLAHHIQKVHLKIPAASASFPCELCERTYNSRSGLEVHVASMHAPHSECHLCGEMVHDAKMKSHIELHNGSSDFPCQYCLKRLISCRSLKLHIGRYHKKGNKTSDDGFKCRHCLLVLQTLEELKAHDELLHKPKEKTDKKKTKATSTKKMKSCSTCNQKFHGVKELREHKRQHGRKLEDILFRCDLCGESRTSSESLQRHVKRHAEGSASFKCQCCTEIFQTDYRATQHMKVVHNVQENLQCELCGKVYLSSDRLDAHLDMHNGVKDFLCKLCPSRYTLSRRLRRHIEICHQTNFFCPNCPEKFFSQKEVRAHLKSEHRNKKGNDKIHKCTICPKAFLTRMSLIQHLERHNDGKSFKCQHCEEEFKTKQKLALHSRRHKGYQEKEPTYRCSVCGKTYLFKKENYEAHMKRHSNPKEAISVYIQANVDDEKKLISFSCKICKQTYSKNSSMNSNNELAIVCQHGNCGCNATFTDLNEFMLHHKKICEVRYGRVHFPQCCRCDLCNKDFSTERQLKRHNNRLHPGENSLICEVCGKRCGEITILKKHMLTHKTERDFQCHICGNNYKSNGDLKRHISLSHNDPRFPCNSCGKKFKSAAKARVHEARVHLELVPKHPCHICGKLYRTKQYAQHHVRMIHLRKQKPTD